MGIRKIAEFSPGRIIFLSILGTILIGTALLALPFARTEPIALLDLLFTATSATCVTGLFTVDLAHFTTFGQAIILLLIQIGGIGLITMSFFIISLFANMGFATRIMAGKVLEVDSWQEIKQILSFIFSLTLAVEALGALLMFMSFKNYYPTDQALFHALFHSVSSFCNAGISLVPDSMVRFQHDYVIIAITMALIIIGGLGFITWHELITYAQSLRKKRRHALSLQTKIILSGTALILIISCGLFWIIEHNNSLAEMPSVTAIIHSMFNMVSCRSAGFTTLNMHQLHLATLVLIMVISFIGSAPGSTGSGVKITTMAIMVGIIRAAVTDQSHVHMQGRTIALEQIYRAVAIIAFGISWIIFTFFCLLITEQHLHFTSILFETVGAFTNLGLSTGVTILFSSIGKIFLMLSMIIGRIGSLTLILALKKSKHISPEFLYPEERIMLG